MLPAWADILIIAALPAILTLVLLLIGDEEPYNTVIHRQEDGKQDGDSEPAGEPPDTADDVLIAA